MQIWYEANHDAVVKAAIAALGLENWDFRWTPHLFIIYIKKLIWDLMFLMFNGKQILYEK